jgi:hypothetical protein
VLFGTVGAVAAFAALFAYGIWWFRFDRGVDEPAEAASDATIADVLTPSPVSSAALAAAVGDSADADLRDVSGGSSSAVARRETGDGRFFFSVKASLPEIDREAWAYEAWLLRQAPYDYFSVGEFETNDDGEWVLEWSGVAGKYDAYTQVVVTLEAKDGNPDPSGHVLEGEFE